jgi:uncharacterized protein involved in response to NO
VIERLLEHPLLSYAFRPFFLGLGAFAVASMAMWLAALLGVAGHRGALWHAHEMLFGFALAAVAGFVLTAVSTWTGRPPVQRAPLLALVLLWLLGRLAMSVDLGRAAPVGAFVEWLFPLALTVVVGREIVLGHSRHNYPLIGIVSAFAAFDGVYQLGAQAFWPAATRPALLAAVYVFVLLITVIGGRIIPSFTRNWLAALGRERLPHSTPVVDGLTVTATLAAGVLAVAAPMHDVTAAAAATACALHGLRLSRWCGLHTLGEPLLFVLHVAYAWLPVGFGLLAASILTDAVPPGSALHALAVGGIGTMILAVTSRVALGHTGRALHAAALTAMAYVVLNLAALARVLSPVAVYHSTTLLEVAAVLWMLGWLVFVAVYARMLTQPRRS